MCNGHIRTQHLPRQKGRVALLDASTFTTLLYNITNAAFCNVGNPWFHHISRHRRSLFLDRYNRGPANLKRARLAYNTTWHVCHIINRCLTLHLRVYRSRSKLVRTIPARRDRNQINLMIQGAKLIGAHKGLGLRALNHLHNITTAPRELFQPNVHVSAPNFDPHLVFPPINTGVHLGKKIHTQDRWYITIQHYKVQRGPKLLQLREP